MFWKVSGYHFLCDDCPTMSIYLNHLDARSNGWAISKDYKKCYCPKCAPKHRNVGRNGVNRNSPFKVK